jgi:hypothetical protein
MGKRKPVLPKRGTAKQSAGAGRRSHPAKRASRSTSTSPPESRRALTDRHDGTSARSLETVYALPMALINAIDAEAPAFFTDEERELERNLAADEGSGSFYNRRFGHPMLDADFRMTASTPATVELEPHRTAAGEINDMIVEEMRRAGRTTSEIQDHFERREHINRRVAEQQMGYSGWLITHARFREEVAQLRRRWEGRIRELGRFPAAPFSFAGERPRPPAREDRHFHTDFIMFYRRWGLDSLVTWELPIPMRPELTQPSLYDLTGAAEAGVLVFVPWHLLRDKQIKLHELADYKRTYFAPEHLRDWLDGRPKKWGPTRYALMLRLFVYLELALRNRYKHRINRNIERLDRAFASVFCDSRGTMPAEDSVKKVRLEMNRRLKSQTTDASSPS